MNRQPAPIFVECFSEAPGAPRRIVVDKSAPVSFDDGLWMCELHAPNGARAQIEIDRETTSRTHGELARAFTDGARSRNLWISPLSKTAHGSTPKVDLIAWSKGKMLEPSQWRTERQGGSGEKRYIAIAGQPRFTIDHIQVAVRDGVSMIVRCPPDGVLDFHCEVVNSAYAVRPMFVNSEPDVAAYWGFTRHNVMHGAFKLGDNLAAAAMRAPLSFGATVAAAHWAVVFGIDEQQRLDGLIKRLDAHGDAIDAKIMSWIMSSLVGAHDMEALESRFWPIATTLLEKVPHYTGTLKLLCEQLAPIASLFSRRIGSDPQAARAMRRLWKLASAMAWDTEYTSYRGLRPNDPDQDALTEHLDERAKKKSAEWRRDRRLSGGDPRL